MILELDITEFRRMLQFIEDDSKKGETMYVRGNAQITFDPETITRVVHDVESDYIEVSVNIETQYHDTPHNYDIMKKTTQFDFYLYGKVLDEGPKLNIDVGHKSPEEAEDLKNDDETIENGDTEWYKDIEKL